MRQAVPGLQGLDQAIASNRKRLLMGMFYSLYFEEYQDASLMGQHLTSLTGDASPRMTDGQCLSDREFPAHIHFMELRGRSKEIKSDLLGQDVTCELYFTVTDSRDEETSLLIADLLCRTISNTIGGISLVSYGEDLLMRKSINSLELFNTRCFWTNEMLHAMKAEWLKELIMHEDRRTL